MSYLRHIEACNPVITERFVPWEINGQVYGWLRPSFIEHLRQFDQLFAFSDSKVGLSNPAFQGEALTAELTDVVNTLYEQGVLPHKPMNEPYPLTAGERDEAIAEIDRVAASHFGLRSFGQHLNGYVNYNGRLLLWVGKRARDRAIFPGAWDNMVAGGLPQGISLEENLIKECQEEAGMSAALAQQATYVGSIAYNRVNANGFRPDVLYCYDIELPATFIPQNTDGEVESFHLMPVEDVLQIVRDTDDFKLNCNLVIIDFALRHRLISEDDPDYRALLAGLRQTPGVMNGLN
jgi:isopentenyldiphosphate isomerase